MNRFLQNGDVYAKQSADNARMVTQDFFFYYTSSVGKLLKSYPQEQESNGLDYW